MDSDIGLDFVLSVKRFGKEHHLCNELGLNSENTVVFNHNVITSATWHASVSISVTSLESSLYGGNCAVDEDVNLLKSLLPVLGDINHSSVEGIKTALFTSLTNLWETTNA